MPPMLLVPTPREDTSAHVTLDTMEMDLPATVSMLLIFVSIYNSVADTDECGKKELNQCHYKATCHDNDGSYECSCHQGFTGNGFICSGNILMITCNLLHLQNSSF